MKSFRWVCWFVIAASLLWQPEIWANETFVADFLDGSAVVPPNDSTAHGYATVVLTDAGDHVDASFRFQGLSNTFEGARIHGPASFNANAVTLFTLPLGVNGGGGICAPVCPPIESGNGGAGFAVTAAQAADLRAGNWYVDVASANFPGGEIRGQLVPFYINSGITGMWYDPAQSGHGFEIEVLDTGDLALTWFVFAPDGAPLWLTGTGPITGSHATVQLYDVVGTGAVFPPAFDPLSIQRQPWGTLTVTFSDCNNGQVNWHSTLPGYSDGSLPIARLTLPAGLSCP